MLRVIVYLLERARNLAIKQVAALAKVSGVRISQIQRQIDDSGGLRNAFHWARKLEEYIKQSVDPLLSF